VRAAGSAPLSRPHGRPAVLILVGPSPTCGLWPRRLPEDEIEQEVAEFRKKKLEALARGDEPAAKKARPGDKEYVAC